MMREQGEDEGLEAKDGTPGHLVRLLEVRCRCAGAHAPVPQRRWGSGAAMQKAVQPNCNFSL